MLIIGAPFGNWFSWPGVISTIGTFTRERRAGWLKRWWRIISTVRYSWSQRTWRNRLGLPNPGIDSVGMVPPDQIVSIHGFSGEDWCYLVNAIKPDVIPGSLARCAVEFNVSCPNSGYVANWPEVIPAIKLAHELDLKVVVKLPPIRWMGWAEPMHHYGVTCFHCTNTMPGPGGGIGGKGIMQLALWAVEEVKTKLHDVEVIGGNGVTCVADAKRYLDAGADHVSIASGLFNPFMRRRRLRTISAVCTNPWR